MDRVQVAAVILAVGLFGLYYATLPAPGTRAVPSATAVNQAPPAASTPRPEINDDATEPRVMTHRRTVQLENDSVRLSVSDGAGRVTGIELLAFPERRGEGGTPVQLATDPDLGAVALLFGDEALEPLEREPWEIRVADVRELELRAERAGVELVQRLALDPEGYGARLSLSIRNRGDSTLRPRLQLRLAGSASAAGHEPLPNYSLLWSRDGSVEREPIAGIGSAGIFGWLSGAQQGDLKEQLIEAPVEVAGADSQYFLLAATSDNPRESQALLRPLGRDLGQLLLQYGVMELPPGTSVERSWRLYFGPKIPHLVRSVDARFEPSIDLGWHWVQPLVHLFAAALKWLHDRVVGNYGWAIIIITVVLRVLTYPLTQRSMLSMKKFGAVAPEMKLLQEKHANDRTKLQEEMMKLYREKGINPLSSLGGGCIPMLIQMPFMVALYFALQSSIELRHAPFLAWIDDLSAPEDLRLFGLPVRLLPLAMGASMLLQQRLTPAPTADPQQRQMMTMMSVLFVVMFYGFPSGLVLYWFVSNLLGIAQQLWVNRTASPAT